MPVPGELPSHEHIIGREAGLARLRGLVDQVPQASQVLLVTGEAGMGKTALLADAAGRARSAAAASSTVLPIPASPVTSRTWLACGTGSTSARSRASPASRPMIAAGCGAGSSPGPGICLSSRPVRLVNAIPRANSARDPSMPAARKVQSRHGYR